MAGDLREEIANYLLNNCFIIGNIDATREKYFYVINHEDMFRDVFRPLGYTIVVHRNLKVVQLVNSHGIGKLELKKYESIMLLILRLLYIQKRESLSTNEEMVSVSVEEIQNEYIKLNLPKKFDKNLLENSLGNIKKYNLAMPIDKLGEINAKIQVYPSVMLALPDAGINTAYESTKEYLMQYKSTNDTEEEDIL